MHLFLAPIPPERATSGGIRQHAVNHTPLRCIRAARRRAAPAAFSEDRSHEEASSVHNSDANGAPRQTPGQRTTNETAGATPPPGHPTAAVCASSTPRLQCGDGKETVHHQRSGRSRWRAGPQPRPFTSITIWHRCSVPYVSRAPTQGRPAHHVLWEFQRDFSLKHVY